MVGRAPLSLLWELRNYMKTLQLLVTEGAVARGIRVVVRNCGRINPSWGLVADRGRGLGAGKGSGIGGICYGEQRLGGCHRWRWWLRRVLGFEGVRVL